MNKVIKGLLVAMLAVSATVQASTNKTFLLPRSHGVNLPMELSSFNQLIHRKAADKFGANFQAVGFFSRTADEEDTGRYFGIKNKNTFNLTKAVAGADAGSTADVDLGLFVHDSGNAQLTTASAATVNLQPKQEAWGVRFDYFQDLEKIVKGLYLKATVPVVHVENNVELKVTSALAIAKSSLENTLQGKANGITTNATAMADFQAPLDHMKMDGKNDSTGVADIDVVLGYNFLNKDCHHVGINIGFTIPTGDEADSVHAFEAIVGNGNHWAFGAGLDGMFRAWGDEDHNVKVTAALNYRYAFKESEKRTLGFKTDQGSVAWGHYLLLAKDTAAANTALVPAANVTTFNVDVTPGSQLDGVIALAYNNGGLCVDFGYNLFWKDEEEVKLKAADATAFDAQKYGVARRDFDTTNIVAAAAHFIGGAAGTLTAAKNLDTKAAETGSQVTHKIFAALGYMFTEWECPLMLGAGGGYEFRGSNDALEKWELWLKLGIGF